MRYFVELRYDGAAYCGWQRQPQMPTVQQTIEQALTKLLRTPTEIVGAGRTDTGVNASYYVAHFDTDVQVNITQLLYKLNMMLPKDIGIFSITQVADTAHARFAAMEREYTYFISHHKNPFRRHSAWLYYVPLDVDAMNQAASKLLNYSDFTSFAKLNSNNKTNICRIIDARWSVEEDGVLRFTIRADRFLRNMVRSIVGTLVDVGRGRYTVDEFCKIVEAKDLRLSSAGAPAQGLFLSDVVYSEETFTKTTNL
ncbi:MAG: tRNA pseudouridine(38-40) synthase TruA [Alistipes sp.]|jgi:tRNA pseudouridine38-40 synthase|nr:tRNA pseudouridine(38-40) synthase TruA [Alistipes sp.]